jgi:hypothetical protein
MSECAKCGECFDSSLYCDACYGNVIKAGMLTEDEFRALLNWWMCSDPWPVPGPDGDRDHETMVNWLNRESRRRGFDGWVDAYHGVPHPPRKGEG